MPLVIRPPTIDELPALGDLCRRSKAVWGYDDKFMEACRDELSFDPLDLQMTEIAVAEECSNLIGVAQVKVADSQADLLKLFVEPGRLRSGIGKFLAWAARVARNMAQPDFSSRQTQSRLHSIVGWELLMSVSRHRAPFLEGFCPSWQ